MPRTKTPPASTSDSTSLATVQPIQSPKLVAYDANTARIREKRAALAAQLSERDRDRKNAQRVFESEHGPIDNVTPADFDALKNMMTRFSVVARAKAKATRRYGSEYTITATSVAKRLEKVVNYLGNAVGELTTALAEDVALATYPDQEQLVLRVQSVDIQTDALREKLRDLDREIENREDGYERRRLVEEAERKAAPAPNGRAAKGKAKAKPVEVEDEDDDEIASDDEETDDILSDEGEDDDE